MSLARVYEVDKIAASVCTHMQQVGIGFDAARAATFAEMLRDQEAAAAARADVAVNRRLKRTKTGGISTKDLASAFFDELGAPILFVSEITGKPALGANALQAYAACHNPALRALAAAELERRRARKIRSTYIESIKVGSDGRVHPSWLSYGTVSGRWACVARGTLVEVLRDVAAYPKGVPIEDVRPGDMAYCFIGGRLALRRVLRTESRGVKSVVRVQWRGTGRKHTGHVDLTADHRVMLTSGVWVAAGELRPGDRVFAMSRGIDAYGYAVLSVTALPDAVETFDLEVEEAHNFIAGELCVHNCQDPNLANLPRASNDPTAPLGGIRSLYVAAPGYVFVYYDKSQIEFRVAAYGSGDEAMIGVCEGGDVHGGNAVSIFGEAAFNPAEYKALKKLDKARTPEQQARFTALDNLRTLAKSSVFAVCYLAEADTVYQRIIASGTPVKLRQVEAMLAKMRRSFQGYYRWQDERLMACIREGYTTSPILGRRRWLGHEPSPPECANFPIQSGAADIMNQEIPAVLAAARKASPATKLVAHVYDSVLLEVPAADATTVRDICLDISLRPVTIESSGRPLSAVLPVDIDLADRWH